MVELGKVVTNTRVWGRGYGIWRMWYEVCMYGCLPIWRYEDCSSGYDGIYRWVCVWYMYGTLYYDVAMVWVCVLMRVWYRVGPQSLSPQDQGTFDVLTRLMNQSLGETYPNKDTSKYG